jgi:hypothetical protein
MIRFVTVAMYFVFVVGGACSKVVSSLAAVLYPFTTMESQPSNQDPIKASDEKLTNFLYC